MSSELQIVIRVLEAYGLAKSDLLTQSDPLVVAKFRGLRLKSARTTAIKNTNNPVWNQELSLHPKRVDDILLLKVYDKDIGKNDLLGYAEVPLSTYFGSGLQDMWLQLVKKRGGLRTQFTSVPGHLHVQIFCGTVAECLNLPQANYCNQSFQNAVAPPFQTTYSENVYTSAHQPVSVSNQGFGNSNQGFGNSNQGFGNSNQGFGNSNQGFGNSNQGLGAPVLVGKETTIIQQPNSGLNYNQTSYAPQLNQNKPMMTTTSISTPARIIEETITTTTTTSNNGQQYL